MPRKKLTNGHGNILGPVIAVLLLVACVSGCALLPDDIGSSDSGGSLQDTLVGPMWRIRSAEFSSGTSLDAVFKADNRFEAMLNAGPNSTERPQRVNGSWHIHENVLTLRYTFVITVGETLPDPASFATEAERQIKITDVSTTRITGLDEYIRLWEFERIG